MAAVPITKRITTLVATQQGKSYAVAAVTLLLMLVMIAFGIFPVVSALFAGIEQNSVKSELLEKMQTKRTILQKLIVEENSKHAVSLALESALPDSLDQVQVINNLNSLAQSTGSTINILNFGTLDTKRDLKIVFNLTSKLDGKSVSISVSGSRAGLERFLSGLEQLRRVVNVRAFTIAKIDPNTLPPGSTQLNLFKMDVQAEVYFGNGG